VVTLLIVFIKAATVLFGRLKVPAIAKSTLGGLVFRIVGVALPLTMFTGSAQLKTVLADAGTLGLGVLIATLIAKMLTFAVSQQGGFVGGPIFPSLFIGGTAGVVVHQVLPGVPLGLAFTCLFAAVPGALVAAPFTMVLLAAFVTQVGGAPDGTRPGRRCHGVPGHGGREVPRRSAAAGTHSRGETTRGGRRGAASRLVEHRSIRSRSGTCKLADCARLLWGRAASRSAVVEDSAGNLGPGTAKKVD